MCKHNQNLKRFRTLEGSARRAAVRAYLAQSVGLAWDKSPFQLSAAERSALDDMARAVAFRKSAISPLSNCAAFYVYLSREVKAASVPANHRGMVTA